MLNQYGSIPEPADPRRLSCSPKSSANSGQACKMLLYFTRRALVALNFASLVCFLAYLQELIPDTESWWFEGVGCK